MAINTLLLCTTLVVPTSIIQAQALERQQKFTDPQVATALQQRHDFECSEFEAIRTIASAAEDGDSIDDIFATQKRLYEIWTHIDRDVLVECLLAEAYEAPSQIELLKEATLFLRTDVVLELLNKKFGPSYVEIVNSNNLGETLNPLRHESMSGNVANVVALLDLGFKPVHDGFILQQAKTFEISEMLLDAGADPNLKAGFHTPLSWALGTENFRTAKLLIKRGARIGDSSLKTSNSERISYLVGCQENCDNPFETLSALDFLSFVLSNESSQLSVPDLKTILFQLVGNPFASQHVKTILEMGVSPNLFTDGGESLLCTASIQQHNNISNISLLLEEGADIEIRTNSGLTALHCAALGGNDQNVECLLNYGADVTARDDLDNLPFDYAREFEGTQAYWALSQGKYMSQ